MLLNFSKAKIYAEIKILSEVKMAALPLGIYRLTI